MADTKEDEVTIVQEVFWRSFIDKLNTGHKFQAKKITVQVKTPKEKQSVEIEENATVRKVRSAIAVLF